VILRSGGLSVINVKIITKASIDFSGRFCQHSGMSFYSPTLKGASQLIFQTGLLFLLSNRLTAQEVWQSSDIGSVGVSGTSSYNQTSDEFTVMGSGANIWGQADAFHYVSRQFTGGFELVVKADSVAAVNEWSKAGLMVRESLAADSKNALMALTAANGAVFQRRVIAAGMTSKDVRQGWVAPCWLKLTRRGNVISGYASADGAAWHLVGEELVLMPETVWVGLAAGSLVNNQLAEAKFSNLQINSETAAGMLPSPWNNRDIGYCPVSGTAGYNDGTYQLDGGGTEIWGSQDNFHYVYQPLPGNGKIVARVDELTRVSDATKGGLMIRESLNANAREAMAAISPLKKLFMLRRVNTGGASTASSVQGNANTTYWLQLERDLHRFTASYSSDGQIWQALDSETIQMPENVYIGLALTSNKGNELAQMKMSQVTVTQAGAPRIYPEPWQSNDIGSVGLQGVDAYADGVFNVKGGGADIAGTADEFRFVYQPFSGDGWILAKVAGIGSAGYTDGFAKAGMMIREGLGADARYAMLRVTHGGTLRLQYRSQMGGETEGLATFNLGAPRWLMLEKQGGQLLGYESADGVAWNPAGTLQLNLGGELYLGLAVSSHNNYALAAGTFEGVQSSTQNTDTDGNGIDDGWELEHFGQPGIDANADADGDGLTNLQEYQQGSDPNDYYSRGANTIIPLITIMGGNNQSGAPNQFLAQPLAVKVSDRLTGSPLINAPVTFSVTQGGGKLALQPSIVVQQYDLLTVRTGADGTAAACYLQAAAENTASQVTVNGGTALTVSFAINTTALTVPTAVSNFKAEEQEDGSIILSWENTATNATTIKITRSDDQGATWQQLASLSPTTTTYTDNTFNVSDQPVGNGAGSLFKNTPSNSQGDASAASVAVTAFGEEEKIPRPGYAIIDLGEYEHAPIGINDQGQVLLWSETNREDEDGWSSYLINWLWERGQIKHLAEFNLLDLRLDEYFYNSQTAWGPTQDGKVYYVSTTKRSSLPAEGVDLWRSINTWHDGTVTEGPAASRRIFMPYADDLTLFFQGGFVSGFNLARLSVVAKEQYEYLITNLYAWPNKVNDDGTWSSRGSLGGNARDDLTWTNWIGFTISYNGITARNYVWNQWGEYAQETIIGTPGGVFCHANGKVAYWEGTGSNRQVYYDAKMLPGFTEVYDLSNNGAYVFGFSGSQSKVATYKNGTLLSVALNNNQYISADDYYYGSTVVSCGMVGRKISNELVVPLGDRVWFGDKKKLAGSGATAPVLTGTSYPTAELTGSNANWENLSVSLVSPDKNLLTGTAKKTKDHQGEDIPTDQQKTHAVLLVPLEIKFMKPDDWDKELSEAQVLLFDDKTRISIRSTLPFQNLDQWKQFFGDGIKIKTPGTKPEGVMVVFTDSNCTFASETEYSEIKIELTRQQLKDLGCLPQNDEDGVEEKSWIDLADGSAGSSSNISDSLAFAQAVSGTLRGGSSSLPESGNLDSVPPNSPPDKTFVMAGGAEIITAEIKGAISRRRQIANQADVFYYSGHGQPGGNLAIGAILPEDVKWDKEMKIAILAGCSVLDINDYNQNGRYSVPDGALTPGERWNQTGPQFLLGYNHVAPSDEQNSDQIVTNWAANHASQGVAMAWMKANDRRGARNACAIEKDAIYYYFHRHPVFPNLYSRYELRQVPANQW
jgi:hypothetical protein